MKHIKISKVLDLAADKYLWNGEDWEDRSLQEFSCVAIEYAIAELRRVPADFAEVAVTYSNNDPDTLGWRIRKGLINLGLYTQAMHAFDRFESGFERQAVRYAWLKFCAQLAREQGD